MYFNKSLQLILIFVNHILSSYSHISTGSSASALASNSMKFKGPKIDKIKGTMGRNKKIGYDDDESELEDKSKYEIYCTFIQTGKVAFSF